MRNKSEKQFYAVINMLDMTVWNIYRVPVISDIPKNDLQYFHFVTFYSYQQVSS